MVATKRDDEALLDLVRSTYHLRARTGHQTLSSSTKDKVEMAGRKISTEPDFNDWFLAMKPILGIRRTPEASQRMCPGSIQRAFKELTLWPEAMATKNAVFNVSRRRDALCNGSKGAEARTLRTAGKLQAGTSVLEGGLFKKKDLTKRVRKAEFVTEEPSLKPLWHEAMADL